MRIFFRSLIVGFLLCAAIVGVAEGQNLRQRLEALAPADRKWVEDACAIDRSLGPAPYVACAERQLNGLAKLGTTAVPTVVLPIQQQRQLKGGSHAKARLTKRAECLDGATLLSQKSGVLVDEPEAAAKIARKLLPRSVLVVLELSDVSGWCRVVDTASGSVGWIQLIHATGTDVPTILRSTNVFSAVQTSDGQKPSVEIKNDADRSISLEVAGKSLKIESKQTSAMETDSGSYAFHATAARARPLLGTQKFENGSTYTWTFWIGNKK